MNRYHVSMYDNDEYIGYVNFNSYDDALEFAYMLESFNPKTHISRLFEIDENLIFNEVDI